MDYKKLSNHDLLIHFKEHRDKHSGHELNVRARNQPFIIFIPGEDDINYTQSLQLLNDIERGYDHIEQILETPSGFLPVYQATEVINENRVFELCPFCSRFLYKGYCEACCLTFAKIDINSRIFIKLMITYYNAQFCPSREKIMEAALKGFDFMKITWKRVAKKFEEKERLYDLPIVSYITQLPFNYTKDNPFYDHGGKTYFKI